METLDKVNIDVQPKEWKGYTLEELRYRRAMALVRREIGRSQLNTSVNNVKTRVSDNGIRGFMGDNSFLKKMKTADYLLLGFKLSNALYKLWRKKKR